MVLSKHFFREIRVICGPVWGLSSWNLCNSWSCLSTFFVKFLLHVVTHASRWAERAQFVVLFHHFFVIFTHFVVVAHSYFCVIPGRFSSFFWCLSTKFGPFLSFFCVFWVICEPVFLDFLRIWSNLCTFLWTHLCLWKLSQRLFSDVRLSLILTI